MSRPAIAPHHALADGISFQFVCLLPKVGHFLVLGGEGGAEALAVVLVPPGDDRQLCLLVRRCQRRLVALCQFNFTCTSGRLGGK